MKSLIKTKASSLQKVADLPRHRHPADLLNAFTRPIDEQLQQINGTFPFGKQLYINASHERLIKTVKNIRMTYRLASL